MSVLKYNNNGTWEGLNIDHASTADSALYDADGNVISSTYLPLSAGSNHHVTGDLYVDQDIIDSNGDTFVADSNYVHTDNNFTTTEKNKLGAIGTIKQDTRTSTTNISGATWQSIVGITGLDASKRYLIMCAYNFVSGYSNGGLSFRFSTDGTTAVTYTNEHPMTLAAGWSFIEMGTVSGHNNYQAQLNPGAAGRTGTVNANATIYAIALN